MTPPDEKQLLVARQEIAKWNTEIGIKVCSVQNVAKRVGIDPFLDDDMIEISENVVDLQRSIRAVIRHIESMQCERPKRTG